VLEVSEQKKRLGQNFLVSEKVINSIIKNANLNKEDTVVEIGPGAGFVTEILAPLVKRLVAVELDTEAVELLSDLPFENLELINKDILQRNFQS
jgi:16S rRNA (adenine1518-N6/adenine1519-N6)-dimethyltransferase